jgi:hypothetical protein
MSNAPSSLNRLSQTLDLKVLLEHCLPHVIHLHMALPDLVEHVFVLTLHERQPLTHLVGLGILCLGGQDER